MTENARFSLTATSLPEKQKTNKTKHNQRNQKTKNTHTDKNKSENYAGCYRILVLRFVVFLCFVFCFFVALCFHCVLVGGVFCVLCVLFVCSFLFFGVSIILGCVFTGFATYTASINV